MLLMIEEGELHVLLISSHRGLEKERVLMESSGLIGVDIIKNSDILASLSGASSMNCTCVYREREREDK